MLGHPRETCEFRTWLFADAYLRGDAPKFECVMDFFSFVPALAIFG